MNLYTVAAEYQTILNHFHEQDGEVEQNDIELLKKLDEFHDDIQDKAVNIASYLKNLEAEYEQVWQARKAMQEREHRLKGKIEWLEDYLKLNLQKCGITEIAKSPYFVIKVKKCPVSVEITEESSLPYQYKKIKEVISIDKNKLKQDLLDGFTIEGAQLQQNIRLEIK